MTRRPPTPAPPVSALTIPTRGQLRHSPLLGARVVLAPIEAADGPELWEAVESSREHLAEWLPWVPFNDSVETSQRYADACAGDWDHGRALRLAIRARHDQRLLGVLGLDNCVHMHRSCELGYWLVQTAVGHGIMTEAARLALRFGFDTVGLHRVRCAAATQNQKSLRVIERLGFQKEGLARHAEWLGGRWVDHFVFARLADDPVAGAHPV